MMESALHYARFNNNRVDGSGIQVFGNYGDVSVAQYAAPDLGPPPDKINDVPELLSPYFTGRNDEIAKIDAAFAATRGDAPLRCIIFGIPGQGKTQLALRYAKLVFEQGRHSHIFWLSAATTEKVNEGFARIASLLHLPQRSDLTQAEKAELAKIWLEDGSNGTGQRRKWLLTVDNANSDTVNLVNNLLPRSNQHGRILATTRTADVARQLGRRFGATYTQLELLNLSIDDAAKLLYSRAHADSMMNDDYEVIENGDIESFKPVAKALGCLPLAIAQAGSFMLSSGQTPSDMLNIDEREGEEILSWKDERFEYEGEPFMTTTLLALDELKTVSPAVIGLLRILSFLDPEAIPIKYLIHGSNQVAQIIGKRSGETSVKVTKRGHRSQTTGQVDVESEHQTEPESNQDPMQIETGDDAELDGVLELLSSKVKLFGTLRHVQRLSLAVMRGKNEDQALWIHDLVQSVFRTTLMTEAERATWLQRAISMINALLQTIDAQLPSTWPEFEGFVLQVQSLSKHADLYEFGGTELLDSSDQVARYLYYCGRTEDAQSLCQRTMKSRFEILGPEDPSTLTSMGNLASTYRRNGRWDEAEILEIKVLETSKRVLGPEHPDTLRSMANLASTYWNKGRWDEAEMLGIEVLETRKRVLGPEHPDTLTSMGNLASTYWNKGRWDEAEMLEIEVMETSKRVLGPEHPDTLTSMNNLASTYRNKGRWDEAEMLEIEVLETRKRVLGPEHPDTLRSMANLASTYWNKGRWDEAEMLEIEVMEARKRVLGPEHPNTLTSMNNLAFTWKALDRFDDALSLMKDVYIARNKKLGANHPDTLSSKEAFETWKRKG